MDEGWHAWTTWSNAASSAWSPVPAAWASRLLKRFLHALQPQHCQALYCHLTLALCRAAQAGRRTLGETPRRKGTPLRTDLERATRGEGTLLLVFDEAHLLDGDALTDLRLLISSALDVRPPLKMLLVGQEPLRPSCGRLATPTCSTGSRSATNSDPSPARRPPATSTSNSARPEAIPRCSTTR